MALALARGARAETTFFSPARGEALAPGSIVEARWASPCRARRLDADEAELVLSLDGGRTFPIRISAELPVCASRLRWIVPALPTGHARLGLRLGSEGRDETEVIEVIGEEFRILPDPGGRSEELFWRAAEAWTRPAIEIETADELLGLSMSPEPKVLPATESVPDADDSGPSGGLRPRGWHRLSTNSSTKDRVASIPPAVSRSASPLPLRE
jgi:hypothetical protein